MPYASPSWRFPQALMFRSPLHHECVVTARERAGTSSASDRERRRGVSPARRPLQPDCAPITPDRAGLLPTKVRPVPFSPVPGPFGGHHHDHTAVGGGCAPQVHARSRSALQPERRRSPPPERRPTVHRPRLLLPCGPRRGPCWSPADRRGRPPLRESGGLRWSSSSPSRRAAGRGGISSVSSSPPAGLLSANPERTG